MGPHPTLRAHGTPPEEGKLFKKQARALLMGPHPERPSDPAHCWDPTLATSGPHTSP